MATLLVLWPPRSAHCSQAQLWEHTQCSFEASPNDPSENIQILDLFTSSLQPAETKYYSMEHVRY